MTIVDRRSLLALFLLCTLLFCSCSTDMTGLSSLHSLNGEGSDWDITPTYEHDYVVIPAAAGDTLVARARALTAALSAQTGVPASLYFDDEEILMRDNARLILIGNTSNTLSQTHLRGFRCDDYLCTTDESVLLLGGKTDTATIAAIDRFCETLLPYADAEILVNADQAFVVRAEYPISVATVNGFSLDNYRIVYPKNAKNGEKAVAFALREAIADRSGFYLDVLCEDAVTAQVRAIAVGACFEETPPSEPSVFTKGSVITLYGTCNYSLCDAAQAFYTHVFPEEAAETVHATLADPIVVATSAPALLSLTGLLDETDPLSARSEISRLSAAIQNNSPAMIPFASIHSDLLPYVSESLSDYTALSLNVGNDCVFPFFYHENALTLRGQTAEGSVHRLQFFAKESGIPFTVCHAFADNQLTMSALLDTLSQTLSESEPTVIFLVTPTSVPMAEHNMQTVRGPYVTEHAGVRMQVLLHLPSAFSDTAIDVPETADEPYAFTFPHSFLIP